MEELVKKMNDYWSSHEATIEDTPYKFFDEYADDEIREIVSMIWDNLFIGGHWNIQNRQYLIENGYKCRTFECDSFGILVAGIGKDGKWLSIG